MNEAECWLMVSLIKDELSSIKCSLADLIFMRMVVKKARLGPISALLEL